MERMSEMEQDYLEVLDNATQAKLLEMVLKSIDMLACEDNYLTMSKQEIFNLIYRYSFEERKQ